MLNYSRAYYNLTSKLLALYDAQEATAIAHEVMQYITGLSKTQRLLDKDILFTELQQEQYDVMFADLLKGRPLQYVTGQAWFMGREYKVNEQVLIPRPETGELVQWIIDEQKNKKQAISILDIGTGSGCIPVSLKLALPFTNVSSCDVSDGAISVAQENAKNLDAEIEFIKIDFLDESEWQKLGSYYIIVSNPPYISIAEKESMHPNVKDHEPALALFVTNNDPLQFYKAITLFGRSHLMPGGVIYCELHKDHAQACKSMFEDGGYVNVEIRKDMHGNWRMLKASIM